MVEVNNLYVRFTREYYALCNINMSIKQNQAAIFFGDYESGRTTLLRTLCGLEEYEKGEVFVNGVEVNTKNFAQNVDLGYLPEKPVFFENKSARQNLEYIFKIRKRKDFKSTVSQVFQKYNLTKIADIKVKKLDKKTRIMLALVRLTLRKLDLVLIDNVFYDLTSEECDLVAKFIEEHFLGKVTTIVVCDNDKNVYSYNFDKVYHFKLGSILD